MRRGLAGQRLVVVFLIGAMLYNYPVLSLFDRAALFLGVPVLFVYMFAVWAALVAIIAWISERGAR